jgi:hypothetical protein
VSSESGTASEPTSHQLRSLVACRCVIKWITGESAESVAARFACGAVDGGVHAVSGAHHPHLGNPRLHVVQAIAIASVSRHIAGISLAISALRCCHNGLDRCLLVVAYAVSCVGDCVASVREDLPVIGHAVTLVSPPVAAFRVGLVTAGVVRALHIIVWVH